MFLGPHGNASCAFRALSTQIKDLRRLFKRAVSPKEYFAPYINNFASILRQRGIEIIDRSLQISRQDQEVVDDVLNTQTWETDRYPEDRRKPYEAMFHDVYVWHCVHRQRALHLSSVLDAKEWFVTLDRRLIWFDAYKSKGSPNWIPTCIDPSTFIQYAQFWTPRSAQFEKALFGSLRLPLLFREFDSETEDVSLAIINRLSRIEAVGDFTSDEIHTLLLNDAVRTKFRESSSDEEQTQMVRDELLTIHKSTVEKAKKLESDLLQERLRKEELSAQLLISQQTGNKERAALEEQNEQKQRELQNRSELVSGLQTQLLSAHARLEEIEKLNKLEADRKEKRRAISKFLGLYFITPFIGASLALSICGLLIFTTDRAILVGCLLAAGITAGVVKIKSHDNQIVQQTPWLRRLCRALSIGWALALGGVATTANAVYSNYLQANQDELIKSAIAKTKLEEKKLPVSPEIGKSASGKLSR